MKKPENRIRELETLAVLATAAIVFYFILHFKPLIYIALGFLLIALFFKGLAARITRGWLKFSRVLGTFNSRVLLTITFYLVLTPIAFFYRLSKKSPLQIRRDESMESYYVDRKHTFSKDDFEKMW